MTTPALPRPRRGTLPVFLAVAFGTTWALWTPLLIAAHQGAEWPTPSWLFFLGSAGPLLGAVAASLYSDGVRGLRTWSARAFSLRFRPRWWLFALGMPVVYFVLGYTVAWIVTGAIPDLAGFGLTQKLPGWNALAVAAVWVLTFGLGEESGWRGWLLPALASRMSVFTASLVVAGVWIAWHIPAFFFNPTYREMGWGLIGWAIALVAGSTLLAWMTRQAAWSIVPVLIWHAGFDLLTAADQSAGVIASTISAVVIFQGVVAAGILWRSRERRP